jgi:hypothetical protein
MHIGFAHDLVALELPSWRVAATDRLRRPLLGSRSLGAALRTLTRRTSELRHVLRLA